MLRGVFIVLLLFFHVQCIPRSWQADVQYTFNVPQIEIPHQIIHSWAQYSPAFPIQQYVPPERCNITQVNILQRHGARFPTSGAERRILQALGRFQNVTTISQPELTFVKNWTYDLGQDSLLPFGELQAQDSGRKAFSRYSSLVSDRTLPFVRASGSPRVISSATNWSAGFADASGGVFFPSTPLILNEASNDTLDDKMCEMGGDSDYQTAIWRDTFAPRIVKRLNTEFHDLYLLNEDIPNLIALCAFHSLALISRSPWCRLFEQRDFEEYEYYGDLDKYYNTGYGQPLGPVQGVGYVNELLARLTEKPVSDATQTNRTLDSSDETFPLNRTIYADFSHDNQMIAIYAALGILRPDKPLDPQQPDPHRHWLVSHLVPFGSTLVTEKLLCGTEVGVRILLNDAVVPLSICGASEDGICSLEAFVESQSYARNNGEGDWEECFPTVR